MVQLSQHLCTFQNKNDTMTPADAILTGHGDDFFFEYIQ